MPHRGGKSNLSEGHMKNRGGLTPVLGSRRGGELVRWGFNIKSPRVDRARGEFRPDMLLQPVGSKSVIDAGERGERADCTSGRAARARCGWGGVHRGLGGIGFRKRPGRQEGSERRAGVGVEVGGVHVAELNSFRGSKPSLFGGSDQALEDFFKARSSFEKKRGSG